MVTFKEFFSFKNNRFFWLNLIAMVVVIVAAAWGTLQWLDSYTRHGEAVVVPDVKGMNLRIAENELDKQSLKSIVIDSSYGDPFEKCGASRLAMTREGGACRFVPASLRMQQAPELVIASLAEQGVAISRYALRTQGSLRRNCRCLLEIPTSLRSSE